jgi:hypothetical protein
MERNDFQYATKVWLTGVLGGTMLLLLFYFRGFGFLLNVEAYKFIAIMLFFVLASSAPSWFLLLLSVMWSNRLRWSVLSKKGLLFGIATLLSIVPYKIFFSVFGMGDLFFLLPYWLSITFGIFYFELQTPELPSDQTSQP